MPTSEPADLPGVRDRNLPGSPLPSVSDDLVERVKANLPNLKVDDDHLRTRLSVAIASTCLLNSMAPDTSYRSTAKKGLAKAAREAGKLIKTLNGLPEATWEMLTYEMSNGGNEGEPLEPMKLDADLRELYRIASRIAGQPIKTGPSGYTKDDRMVFQLAHLYEELTGDSPTHWLETVPDPDTQSDYKQHRVPGSHFATFVRLLMPEIDSHWNEKRLRTALDKFSRPEV